MKQFKLSDLNRDIEKLNEDINNLALELKLKYNGKIQIIKSEDAINNNYGIGFIADSSAFEPDI